MPNKIDKKLQKKKTSSGFFVVEFIGFSLVHLLNIFFIENDFFRVTECLFINAFFSGTHHIFFCFFDNGEYFLRLNLSFGMQQSKRVTVKSKNRVLGLP